MTDMHGHYIELAVRSHELGEESEATYYMLRAIVELVRERLPARGLW